MTRRLKDPPSIGRRERKRLANRRAILEAASRVFAALGFDGASIRDIVRESGLSPGTFYNYFGDKETVFHALIEDFMVELRERLRTIRAGATTPDALISDAFHAYIELLTRDDALLNVIRRSVHTFRAQLLESPHYSGIIDDLRNDLQQAIQAGIVPSFDVDMMTAAMIGAGLEVSLQMAHHKPQDVAQSADFLAQLFLGGIDRLGRSVD